jgi:hypothetical protein
MLAEPMRPPRPPPAVIRRFARLSRAAHRFHRLAHHPLCDRYAGELIRLGKRTRVCRGCVLLYGGGLSGVALGFALGLPRIWLFVAVTSGFALASASLARRTSKWLGRFAPAAALGVAVGGALGLGRGGVGVLLAVALALGVATLVYRRRGPSRRPCAACPERGARVCSGFLPIVRRERAVQRVVRPLLLRIR